MYPFLIVLAGSAGAAYAKRPYLRLILGAFYVWLLLGTLSIAPSYLAYFNELAGGLRGGMHILVDSNLDWGQDLPGLKRWMATAGVERIYLSYFGSGLPEFYGIDYIALPSYHPLLRSRASRLDPQESEYVAVSATNLQKVYLHRVKASSRFKRFLDELREQQEPVAVIGGSIYVYRLPPGPPRAIN
jgi:hypothetical protein